MLASYRLLIALLFLSLQAVAGQAFSAPIASVNEVVNSALREPPGATKLPVRLSDELVQDEHVQTLPRSAVKLIFIDGSEMRLDESSEVVLTQYVFDPASQTSNALLHLGAGIFHFVSGDKNDEGVVLQTTAATIGIRGTEIMVAVSLTGATRVHVIEGAIVLQPTGTGIGATVSAGQIGTVAGPNANASVSHARGGSTEGNNTRSRAERGDPGNTRSSRSSASAGTGNSGSSGGNTGGSTGGNTGGGTGGSTGGNTGGNTGSSTDGGSSGHHAGHCPDGERHSTRESGTRTASASKSVSPAGARSAVSGRSTASASASASATTSASASASASAGRNGLSGSTGSRRGATGGRGGDAGSGGKSGKSR